MTAAKDTTDTPPHMPSLLSSHSPATEFAEGYPIGNGRIGVMCFGGPARQMFAINHYELWYRPRSNSKPLPGFWADVRRKALAGEWPVVGRAIAHAFDPWENSDEGSFQPG